MEIVTYLQTHFELHKENVQEKMRNWYVCYRFMWV